MCRSSRILCFLLSCAAVAPASAQGRVGFHAAPRVAMPVFHHAPTIVRPHTNLRVPFVVRRGPDGRVTTLGRGGRRFGYGVGFGGFGLDGVGLGLATLGDAPGPAGEAPWPAPQVIPADIPAPCVRPLIIAVGHGLRHVARTRVVYGAPTTCRP